MMVKDPIIASGAVGANSMAAPMVKVLLIACAARCEKPDGEHRNNQKPEHKVLLFGKGMV